MQKLLTVRELSALLGITSSGYYQRVRNGRPLPTPILIGKKKRLFDPVDVESFIQGCKQQTA